MNISTHSKKKVFIVILVILLVIIFILGSKINDPLLSTFYNSYFADILIPFLFYFLLTINEHKHPKLNKWYIKAILVFLLCALSETLQFFGIYALARVFDPVDYLMYGIGVLLAATIDKQIFKRFINYWQ